MYCSHCGHEVPDDTKRCPYCGEDLHFERDALRKKPAKKRRGLGTALAILGVVAALASVEAVWFFHTPSSGASGGYEDPGDEPGGITDLLGGSVSSSADDLDDASALAEYDYLPSVEPTPTATVTPLADLPEIAASTVHTPTPTPTPAPTNTPTPGPTTSPTPSVSPAPSTAPASDDYVLATSNTALLTEDQLKSYDAGTLRLIRNEIYARHGLIFKSADLNAYFSSKSWYHGTVSSASEIALNAIEKQNVDLINAYEKKNGINQ